MTPMSRTLHSANWLLSLLESEVGASSFVASGDHDRSLTRVSFVYRSQPAQPNSTLERFFALCTPNPRADVIKLVDTCLGTTPKWLVYRSMCLSRIEGVPHACVSISTTDRRFGGRWRWLRVCGVTGASQIRFPSPPMKSSRSVRVCASNCVPSFTIGARHLCG